MDQTEIIGLIVAVLGVGGFSVIFTILYRGYTKASIREIKAGKQDIELIDEYIYNDLPRTKFRRKIVGFIKNLLFYILMIVIIPFFVFSIINKFQGNITTFGSYGIIAVASGSMSNKHPENQYLIDENLNNQFNQYDIIVIQEVKSNSELKLYDVISFTNSEGRNIIHRIVGIEYDSNGSIRYVTRGDSNGRNEVDMYRPVLSDIHGKYIDKKIPAVGMFVLFMQTSLGFITFVALAYCLIMVDKLTSKVTNEQEIRLKKLENVFDFGNTNPKEINEKYIKVIYYQGFSYSFNEDGFVDKQEITEEKYLNVSKEKAIRVIEEDGSNVVTSSEFTIEREESEGDPK